MDLPEIVSGLRIRQMTPFGNMHVKITVDPRADRELEVFAQLGKGGDVANSDLEAICRMISLWLRSGGSLHLVIKQLQGIGTSLQIPTRAGRIMSLGDGLACALKKYRRAKERFGLRSLLLGEIDLAELDNPNPAPHRPETKPVDHPVSPSRGKNGGSALRRTTIAATVTDTTIVRTQAAAVDKPVATPQARHAGSNGNGNGHGTHSPKVTEKPVVAKVATSGQAMESAVKLQTQTAVLEANPSAAEVRAIAANDLASVLGEVQHRHDSASHYKVMCPECGGPLALQEGCRKCPGCGWSAC
jgi:hypothetical protein